MQFLTFDQVKAQLRLDDEQAELERSIITTHAKAAEDAVLNLCNRTMEDIIEQYGQVPKPLYVAALMLVEVDYTNRSPNSMQNMYQVGYSFDMKVKPYMKLT